MTIAWRDRALRGGVRHCRFRGGVLAVVVIVVSALGLPGVAGASDPVPAEGGWAVSSGCGLPWPDEPDCSWSGAADGGTGRLAMDVSLDSGANGTVVRPLPFPAELFANSLMWKLQQLPSRTKSATFTLTVDLAAVVSTAQASIGTAEARSSLYAFARTCTDSLPHHYAVSAEEYAADEVTWECATMKRIPLVPSSSPSSRTVELTLDIPEGVSTVAVGLAGWARTDLAAPSVTTSSVSVDVPAQVRVPQQCTYVGGGRPPPEVCTGNHVYELRSQTVGTVVQGYTRASFDATLSSIEGVVSLRAVPVPDFDNDGDTDISVFRPSTGTWFVKDGLTQNYGTDGDIPVPADYDGDDKADIAVFRPSTGTWFISYSGGGSGALHYGTSGDVAVPADYDGDHKADIAVFRGGTWFIHPASGTADITTNYGTSGDIPVVADYDGDNRSDIAVFRPSNGVWFLRHSSGTADEALAFGTSGDTPVPGNYDLDAITDVAVFRPSNGIWFVENGQVVSWGVGTDIPLPLPPALRYG